MEKKIQTKGRLTFDIVLELMGKTGQVAPPVNLNKVMDYLGIRRIKGMVLEGFNHSGFIRKAQDGVKEVWVSPYDSPARQRFTLAHEIAHALLHGDCDELWEDGETLRRSGNREPREYEANWFAANLLMPRRWVMLWAPGSKELSLERAKAWAPERDKLTEEELVELYKEAFFVSGEAMRITLEDMGLIKKEPFQWPEVDWEGVDFR